MAIATSRRMLLIGRHIDSLVRSQHRQTFRYTSTVANIP
jgi:hypothetical protein